MGTTIMRRAAVAMAMAALLAACGSAETEVEAAPGDSTGTSSTETAPAGTATSQSATIEVAPQPTGPVLDPSVLSGEAMTISGEAFDLGTLADKDLVVWFWAPW